MTTALQGRRPFVCHSLRAANLVGITSVIALALSGCGGGGGDTDSGATSDPTSNRAPSIAGSPTLLVLAGQSYSFRPTASDPDGDPLTFAVSGLPGWAKFDTSTGIVTGTPGQADVGTTSSIVLSVTDGKASAALTPFTIQVSSVAEGSAVLSWMPPTENEDGSPLTDLAGYRVYWGTAEGIYDHSLTLSSPGITRVVIEPLTPATWHFAIAALNSKGIESQFSNIETSTVL